jgi:ABC-2 type transport system permease protein
MRKVLEIARLNLLQTFKDRAALISFIGLPLILTLVFGLTMGGGERRIAVGLVDGDRTAYSAEMAKALPTSGYELRPMSAQAAEGAVALGQLTAAIVVPKGFGADVMAGRDVTVTVVKNQQSTTAMAVTEAVRGAAQRMAGNGVAVRNVAEMYGGGGPRGFTGAGEPGRRDAYDYARSRWDPVAPVTVDAIDVTRTSVRSDSQQATGFSQYSLGFTVTFMMFMALGAAGGFLEERELGTLARLLTTPTSKSQLIGGKVAGIYLTTIAQAGFMIVAGAAVFAVPWGSDPLGVAVVLGAFALAATGMGTMMSTLVRTRGQLSAITSVLAIAMAMLGGCYWPIDIVSPAMRTIGMVTPNYWAMQGLVAVIVREQGLAAAIVPAAVLLGFAGVFFAVGLVRLRLE